MLRRKEGATIAQIVAATGWQPHTVRGAFAGALKKKLGLTVTSEKVERHPGLPDRSLTGEAPDGPPSAQGGGPCAMSRQGRTRFAKLVRSAARSHSLIGPSVIGSS